MKLGKNKTASVLLATSMLFTGAAGMIIQFILAVTASNILGSSHAQYALTGGLMMGFMGLGGWAQKFVQKNLITKFLSIEIALSLLMGFACLGLYSAHVYLPNYVEIVQCLWISAVGFLIGFEIPIISRVNEEYQPELKDNLASITSMDYLGGMIGGLAWIYFFLGKMPLSKAGFIAAGLNLLVATMTFLYFANKQKRSKVIRQGSLLVAVLGIMFFGYMNADKVQISLKQKSYEDPIVYEKQTPYQSLAITYHDKADDTRLYINGNLQFSSVDEHRYHEHLVVPAMERSVKRNNVLIMGGGDGMALREVLKYEDVKSVELVDLDAEMVRLFKQDSIFARLNDFSYRDARVHTISPELQNEGVMPVYTEVDNAWNQKETYEEVSSINVYTMDAVLFAQAAKRKLYDVIIIDFPDPSIPELAKLYTEEFYVAVKNMLAPGGTISIQATSPYHAKESYLCIQRTMESAGLNTLPYHHNIPSFGDWGWFLAWKDSDCYASDIKSTLQEEFMIETKYLTPDLLAASMTFGKGTLETESTHINTILHPILLTDYVNESWVID